MNPSSDGAAANVISAASQLRVARPTERLGALVRFYREGLGLAELGRFEDHSGFDGVMLGEPTGSVHLEFTRSSHGTGGAVPGDDQLLVFYLGDVDTCRRFERQVLATGEGTVVPPANSYWTQIGAVTLSDPDGYRVVLAPTSGL